MQQKSKFIIFISLICFISLLLLPVKVWGVNNDDPPGGGTCICENGKEVWSYSVCLSYGPVEYAPGLFVDACQEWGIDYYYTNVNCNVVCGDLDTTQEPKDEWCCTCNGVMDTCYECTSGSSTKEECEECCPCGYIQGCRKANLCGWPFQPPCSDKYCKSNAEKWCEVKENDECSSLGDRCIDCNTDTGQCFDSVTVQKYTSLSTCESQCFLPCSVTATADPNPVPYGQHQTIISATNFSHTSIDKCKVTEPIPQTFTNIALPQNFQVSCTGDTGYNDCSNTITVTEQSAPATTKYSCNETTWTCEEDPSGTSLAICQSVCIAPVSQFDFSLSNSGDIVTTKPTSGTAGVSNIITATLVSGDTKSVSFSQSTMPSGVSALSIASCSPTCSKYNTLTVDSSAPTGTFPMTITGTAGGLTRTTTYNLIIEESTPEEPTPEEPTSSFDFSLSNSGDITVIRPYSGSLSASNIISANLIKGDTQSVEFSQTGLPNGVTAKFIYGCNPDCSRTNTLSISSSASIGTFPIKVRGTSLIEGFSGAGIARYTTYDLVIKKPTIITTTTTTTTTIITCNYNVCRKSSWSWLTGDQTLYCKSASKEVESASECPEDACQTDADCVEPVVHPPTKYSCNETNWTCEEDPNGTSLAMCQADCVEPVVHPPTKYSCNETNWTCEEDPNGTSLAMCQADCVEPPPLPPPPTCDIYEFSLNGKNNDDSDPLYVWVGSLIKGLVSTNAYCETCTVESTDTWGNDPDPEVYTMTLNNGYNAKEEFRIDAAGIYSFKVKCIGNPVNPDDFAEDIISLETVQAINLPWWQEIIPVLRGFLGGV